MSHPHPERRPLLQALYTFKLLGLLAALAAASALAEAPMRRSSDKPDPRVQIALLLDNSGSMSGLLNQARTQMWRVVNEFATAKQHGKPIRLEIALYEYGETVKRLSPLTANLDAVSEQLFGLGIRGGDEYCGSVIATAVRELEWSGNPDDLKLIYIAGNEPFTQGPVKPAEAIAAAQKKGISVNVIHCGGDDASWRQGAVLAGTHFMMINQNAQVAVINAPQDAELARLGAELNKTYVGYGALGGASIARQSAMDSAAAAAAPAAAAERASAKSGRNYDNSEWDLLDGLKGGKVKLEEMKAEELPEPMRKMNQGQREVYVQEKETERVEVQKRITELSDARKKYIAEQQKKAPAGENTLDQAMTESVRREAAKKAAFSF